MTACIVGWGHLPFGKHEGRDVESLIVEAATAPSPTPASGPGEVDEIVSRPLQRRLRAAGLHRLARPPGRSRPPLQAGDPGRERLRHRLRRRPCRPARDRGARRPAIVLVVGVEKMTELGGPEIGDTLLKASYLKEEQGIEGGFAGVFGQIAQSYFQRHGDQSDALAAIAAKNHRNGVGNPYAQIRKDLGFEFCRQHRTRTPSSPAPQAHRLLARLRRGGRPGAGRRRDGARHEEGGGVPRRRRRSATSCRCPARHRGLRGLRRSPGRRRWAAARLGLDDLDLVETHDCFTIAELWNTRPWA